MYSTSKYFCIKGTGYLVFYFFSLPFSIIPLTSSYESYTRNRHGRTFNQKIEINCDMGEGFGKWKMGPGEELMQYIDTVNISCGYHAGDPSLMLKTVRLAKKFGVKAGAHPGLPSD